MILAIALPVMAFTILSFPLVKTLTLFRNELHTKSMLQVLYIGGSKVSLPDACADVFPPRWRRHICQLEEVEHFLLRRCCEVSKCCEGEE